MGSPTPPRHKCRESKETYPSIIIPDNPHFSAPKIPKKETQPGEKKKEKHIKETKPQ